MSQALLEYLRGAARTSHAPEGRRDARTQLLARDVKFESMREVFRSFVELVSNVFLCCRGIALTLPSGHLAILRPAPPRPALPGQGLRGRPEVRRHVPAGEDGLGTPPRPPFAPNGARDGVGAGSQRAAQR